MAEKESLASAYQVLEAAIRLCCTTTFSLPSAWVDVLHELTSSRFQSLPAEIRHLYYTEVACKHLTVDVKPIKEKESVKVEQDSLDGGRVAPTTQESSSPQVVGEESAAEEDDTLEAVSADDDLTTELDAFSFAAGSVTATFQTPKASTRKRNLRGATTDTTALGFNTPQESSKPPRESLAFSSRKDFSAARPTRRVTRSTKALAMVTSTPMPDPITPKAGNTSKLVNKFEKVSAVKERAAGPSSRAEKAFKSNLPAIERFISFNETSIEEEQISHLSQNVPFVAATKSKKRKTEEIEEGSATTSKKIRKADLPKPVVRKSARTRTKKTLNRSTTSSRSKKTMTPLKDRGKSPLLGKSPFTKSFRNPFPPGSPVSLNHNGGDLFGDMEPSVVFNTQDELIKKQQEKEAEEQERLKRMKEDQERKREELRRENEEKLRRVKERREQQNKAKEEAIKKSKTKWEQRVEEADHKKKAGSGGSKDAEEKQLQVEAKRKEEEEIKKQKLLLKQQVR